MWHFPQVPGGLQIGQYATLKGVILIPALITTGFTAVLHLKCNDSYDKCATIIKYESNYSGALVARNGRGRFPEAMGAVVDPKNGFQHCGVGLLS